MIKTYARKKGDPVFMSDKIINDEEMKDAVGGTHRPDSKMARVFSIDGGDIKLYRDSIEGNKPYRFIPDGSEMKVDPNMQPEGTYLFKKTEACYWGCYDRVWYCIRANEVRIEW